MLSARQPHPLGSNLRSQRSKNTVRRPILYDGRIGTSNHRGHQGTVAYPAAAVDAIVPPRLPKPHCGLYRVGGIDSREEAGTSLWGYQPEIQQPTRYGMDIALQIPLTRRTDGKSGANNVDLTLLDLVLVCIALSTGHANPGHCSRRESRGTHPSALACD